MKRLAIFTFATVAVLFFLSSSSSAQSTNTGNQRGVKTNWVDLNGDGLCDNVGTANQGKPAGKGYGKRDGSGTPAQPQDGSGFGKKGGNATASGVHDGTGPKGSSGYRGGRK